MQNKRLKKYGKIGPPPAGQPTFTLGAPKITPALREADKESYLRHQVANYLCFSQSANPATIDHYNRVSRGTFKPPTPETMSTYAIDKMLEVKHKVVLYVPQVYFFKAPHHCYG
jgi:hypothetical protein